MAKPRLWFLFCRRRRNILKHIRGYLMELNDAAGDDTLSATSPPDPLPLAGVSGTDWQKPLISAPIPSLGGERLCLWAFWETMLPTATQTLLDEKEAAFPALIRTMKQQGTGTGVAFVPSESRQAAELRVKNIIGWIDQ